MTSGLGIPGDPVDSGSSRVLREDSLGLASWREAGRAQQSWPGCPVTAAVVGGQGKAGWDRERLVAGWQALLSAPSLISPGCLGGKVEAGFKCLLSVLQLGAEPGERERCWQHLIPGQMRGEAH